MPSSVALVGPHGARIDLVDDHDDVRHRVYAVVDADGNEANMTGMELNDLVKTWLDLTLDGGEA